MKNLKHLFETKENENEEVEIGSRKFFEFAAKY